MEKALYGLFVLTLGATLYGLTASGVSLAVSLMLFGPIAVAVFTAGAFVYLLVAVIFERSPNQDIGPREKPENWLSGPALQHSNS